MLRVQKARHFVTPTRRNIGIISQHLFVWKILVFICNVGIVCYLVYHLRHNHPARVVEGPGSAEAA